MCAGRNRGCRKLLEIVRFPEVTLALSFRTLPNQQKINDVRSDSRKSSKKGLLVKQ